MDNHKGNRPCSTCVYLDETRYYKVCRNDVKLEEHAPFSETELLNRNDDCQHHCEVTLYPLDKFLQWLLS